MKMYTFDPKTQSNRLEKIPNQSRDNVPIKLKPISTTKDSNLSVRRHQQKKRTTLCILAKDSSAGGGAWWEREVDVCGDGQGC